MKKFLFNLQKIALAAVMATGFFHAISNINVACCAFSYQPNTPKSLEAYKNLKDD